MLQYEHTAIISLFCFCLARLWRNDVRMIVAATNGARYMIVSSCGQFYCKINAAAVMRRKALEVGGGPQQRFSLSPQPETTKAFTQ